MECYHCGKTTLFGRSHTHHRGVAGGRWKKRAPKTQRIFKPNLQAVFIIVKGENHRVKLCMKCLKRIKKDMTDGKRPFVQLANIPANLQKEPVVPAQALQA
jgi:large subunit ribosomal protein L28